MVFRLAAAAIVSSFFVSVPLTASALEVGLDPTLALPQIEAVTQVPFDLAPSHSSVLVQLPPIDAPSPLLAAMIEQPPAEIVEVAIEAGAERAGPEIDLYASLRSEWFIDPNEGNTFALIAADLASAGDLTTGSLSSERRDPEIVPVTGEGGEFSGGDLALSPLVDDALSFEGPATP